ncbi:MAG: hypothetical protein KGZ91_01555 [Afipia sp.]|nr:hypothetical protein [Afipia sp.]
MTERRLTVDAVLKLAHATALKHANTSPNAVMKSPEMVKAIDQVWQLVKGRLGEVQAAPLDDLIQQITGKAKAN